MTPMCDPTGSLHSYYMGERLPKCWQASIMGIQSTPSIPFPGPPPPHQSELGKGFYLSLCSAAQAWRAVVNHEHPSTRRAQFSRGALLLLFLRSTRPQNNFRRSPVPKTAQQRSGVTTLRLNETEWVWKDFLMCGSEEEGYGGL